VRVTRIIILISFIFTYVLGDFAWVFGQQSMEKHLVLFILKTHGISEMDHQMLIGQLRTDPTLSRNIRFIELDEININLAANRKSQLSSDALIEDMAEAAKFAGVKWIVICDIKRVRAMHMVTLSIVDVELEKTIDSINEDEPSTLVEIRDIIIKNVIEKLIGLVTQEDVKVPVTVVKKKKSRTLYYILGALVAIGGGVAAAAGGGGDTPGPGHGPSDLPGIPPGPPNQ